MMALVRRNQAAINFSGDRGIATWDFRFTILD
jgi:hypothetical protein